MSKVSNVFAARDAMLALMGDKAATHAVALSAVCEAIRLVITDGNNRNIVEAARGVTAVKGRGKVKEAARAAFAAAVNSVPGLAYSAGTVTDIRPKGFKKAGPIAGDAAADAAASAFAEAYASAFLMAEAASQEARDARKVAAPAADTSEVDAAASASIADAASVIAENATLRTLAELPDDVLHAMVADDEASAARIVAVLTAALVTLKASKVADEVDARASKKAAQATRMASRAAQGALAAAMVAAGVVKEELATV